LCVARDELHCDRSAQELNCFTSSHVRLAWKRSVKGGEANVGRGTGSVKPDVAGAVWRRLI
jgi:hypothetical protein